MPLRLLPRLPPAFLLVALTAFAAGPARLTLSGSQITTVTLTAADLAACPHIDLEAADPHGGAKHIYTGIPVRDLLEAHGVPLGEHLRGRALQLAVRVAARDGYAVVFALAEFDPAFSRRTILLADQIDHQPLPAKAAPLQLIVPGDSKAARWIRMVDAIEIISLAPAP
jgi:hypothetical protein